MIINSIKFILVVGILLSPFLLPAQLFKKSLNEYDENGKRKGHWCTYWDDDKRVPMSKARYKNGREVGVSKEYHINGTIRLKFRYHKNRLRVKYYDENRRLEQKGWAILEYNEADSHYYWQGKWKFYNANRKVDRISHYVNGEEVVNNN